MGHYTTLTEVPAFKVAGITWEEFQGEWKKFVDAEGEFTYLDIYQWSRETKREAPNELYVTMACDEYYAKHYSDEKLAEFIATVIAEGDSTILEYADTDGDGGKWGYYITRGEIKDIEYVRMVDGKPI